MRNNLASQLLFELSRPGRRAMTMPACDVPDTPITELLPEWSLAETPPPLPEMTEPGVVRHFVNLSTLNMSVDAHFYPLGSCTMKYNPKRHEQLASLPGFIGQHPMQPDETVQGLLQIMYELEGFLAEISGLPAVSLQPAAGAHGELTALMTAAALFRDKGEDRTTVLAPDSAHGTNPASASVAGFDFKTVKSDSQGRVDLEDLAAKLDDKTAVFMITNPSTLGLFDELMPQVAQMVHDTGGLVYLDGANMNAIMGITSPGACGADMMHFNPHKTFSTPHGGGGPGAGPICVIEDLGPYLPSPSVILEDSVFRLDYNRPKSIGRVRSCFGNVGVLIRAYIYILTHGPERLQQVSEDAVLNANYLLSQVKHILPVPHGDRCMHEFVASAATLKKERGVTATDIAKRLLDFGFHAPTVYFPLTIPEALMVEPTETESSETLEAFAQALFRITEESPELLHEAPHSTQCSRPDEVTAARKPVFRWTPDQTG